MLKTQEFRHLYVRGYRCRTRVGMSELRVLFRSGSFFDYVNVIIDRRVRDLKESTPNEVSFTSVSLSVNSREEHQVTYFEVCVHRSPDTF